MFSKLFGTDSFLDMLGTPTFWFTLVIIIGLVVAVITSIKNWNSGGKFIITGLFIIGNLVLSGYCLLQINYYYTSQGGIHGIVSGIFDKNEVEVVDNLNFEFKNIELTDKGNGIYSASITTNDGTEKLALSVSEKKKYSQLITNEFYKGISEGK